MTGRMEEGRTPAREKDIPRELVARYPRCDAH